MRLRISEYTNLYRILPGFQVIVDYWSNFRFRQVVPLFKALVRGESLNSQRRSSASRNIALSVYSSSKVQDVFRYLKPFRRKLRV